MPKSAMRNKIKNLIKYIVIFLLAPVTIYLGIVKLDDRKYYFISLLLIIYGSIIFFIRFEKREPKLRELMMIAVLVAIGVAGRAAFYMVPQFKPVLAIVIIAGVGLDPEAGFLVGACTAFVSNFVFGQGPWTPWQMFSFAIIGFIAGLIFKKGRFSSKKWSLSIFGLISAVVIYGGIMNPASVLMYQASPSLSVILASYGMGLPFDLIHGVATFIFLMLLSQPMLEKIMRIKIKYGLLKDGK